MGSLCRSVSEVDSQDCWSWSLSFLVAAVSRNRRMRRWFWWAAGFVWFHSRRCGAPLPQSRYLPPGLLSAAPAAPSWAGLAAPGQTVLPERAFLRGSGCHSRARVCSAAPCKHIATARALSLEAADDPVFPPGHPLSVLTARTLPHLPMALPAPLPLSR